MAKAICQADNNMYSNRTTIKIGGESGQGINTVGRMLNQALNRLGFFTFANREYPSLIKGGVASYQVDIANKKIYSSAKKISILCTLSEKSLHTYIYDLLENAIIIHDGKDVELTPDEEIFVQKNNIQIIYLDSVKIALEAGGIEIMANVVLLGYIWKILKLDANILVEEVLELLEGKNIDIEAEKACILAGYNHPSYRDTFGKDITLPSQSPLRKLLMSGNEALSLGALSAGMRAFYGYPMTPATSIFKFLGETANETKIVVKQAENEITAVQMALGSMYMGTRALVATSGGGFDLMIESISCAGMAETPLVIALAQRIGPGTGVPTWTGSGDIYTAVKGGHGDFPRCVISISDIESAFSLTQKAFNIADKYQLPVIILIEKQISEAIYSTENLPHIEKIERGVSTGENRYQITDSGISPRWIPTKGLKPYLHTSDEHTQEGYSTDIADQVKQMSDKRERKMNTLKTEIPEPQYIGNQNAEVIFIGNGSTKNAVLDAQTAGQNIAYLSYEYIYPLKTETVLKLVNQGKRLVLIENNQTGQLGQLIKEECGYEFTEKLLKYDGRPFFIDDILDYLNK